MKFSTEIFLALRYLKPKRNFISVLTILSVLGPILGVAVLLIVIAIMTGFDRDIKERILSMQSHIILTKPHNIIENPLPIIDKLKTFPGISAAPMAEGPVLIQSSRQIAVAILKGIIPQQEQNVSGLKKNMVLGEYNISEGEALIGSDMASAYNLSIGDKILIHSLTKIQQRIHIDNDGSISKLDNEVSLPEEMVIKGIFSMGMYEYDSGIVFAYLDQADSLFDMEWGEATSVKIKTETPFILKPTVDFIKKRFPGYNIQTWQQANKQLFGALAVEKKLMFFLLFFIVIVAAFGIAGTLITLAVQKTREIGVLKAVGATRGVIMRIFILQGFIIGVVGTILGAILGILVIENRTFITDKILANIMGVEIFPKELYHLNKIPAEIMPADLTVIVFIAIILCVAASLVPAMFAAFQSPAESLKTEH
ncbi:MAG: ABC transporter permease [Verrucomicrobiota bacterium]|nr:ABC transporter permease [Verrucomicrobiota bacterium]